MADGVQPTIDPAHDAPGDSSIPVDIALESQHAGTPVVEGLPDYVDEEALARNAAAARSHHEAVPLAYVEAAPVQTVSYDAYATVDASTTTDTHHDQGSSATGQVEATPDTAAAGPPEEEKHEDPPPPPPEDPPPPPHDDPAATPEHHDDPAPTTEPEHTS